MEGGTAQLDMKLLFVYNADSGLFNLLADAAHRVVHPSTYPCRLCAVTYSFTGMRSEWRDFIQSLDHPVEFLHRDELTTHYGIADVPLLHSSIRGTERICGSQQKTSTVVDRLRI